MPASWSRCAGSGSECGRKRSDQSFGGFCFFLIALIVGESFSVTPSGPMLSACAPPSLRGLRIDFLFAGFTECSADGEADQFNAVGRNGGFKVKSDGEAVRKFFCFVGEFGPLAGTAEEVASLLVLHDVAHTVMFLRARFCSIRGIT